MTISSRYYCALVAFLTLAISSAFAASSARGVIISTGDGTGNTTAPGDDPGWANVGWRGTGLGGGSAVYLGDRWVLTANHVGANNVFLNGNTYLYDGTTSIRIQNPTGMGLTMNTDLRLFRITTDPGLPTLTISASAPSNGSTAVMIGAGRNRAASTTTWGSLTGYSWLESRSMRWGQNVILDNAATTPSYGHGDVLSLVTEFNTGGSAIADEAQGSLGDSGGALFYKNGLQWELAGIMVAIGTFEGQVANTSVFGNVTISADLSQYRDQIYEITGIPEPATGSLMIFAFAAAALVRRKRASR